MSQGLGALRAPTSAKLPRTRLLPCRLLLARNRQLAHLQAGDASGLGKTDGDIDRAGGPLGPVAWH
jgi:hypothetical protein